jgi:tol-pal system protein YbgF
MKSFRLSLLARASGLALAAFLASLPVLAQDALPPSVNATTYTETRLSAMEDQMRALNGKVEQIEFAVRRIDQSVQRMQSDNDARLTKLEQQTSALAAAAAAAPPAPVVIQQPAPQVQPIAQPVAPQQPVPLSQNNTTGTQMDASANGTLGALKMQDGHVTGGVNNPQAPPLPATPPDYGLTPQEQYDRAFDMLRQADYPNAETAFKTFIDKNPKDKLIDNAKYWYGETLYVRARFDESAVAFADAYQTNPQGAKAPDSLLKLAMSLAALNKTPDACVTLTELKSKYPNAAATIKSRAGEERTRLKCPMR